MTGRLVYRDNDKSIYEVEGQPGVVDHIDYGTPQPDGTLIASPMMDRVDQALTGLKQIADTPAGTSLNALQLTNAVRLLARAAIALVRLRTGRRETD